MKIDIYKSIFLLILGVFVYCYFENNKTTDTLKSLKVTLTY